MTLLGMELGTLEVKGEWSDHYTTEAPLNPLKTLFQQSLSISVMLSVAPLIPLKTLFQQSLSISVMLSVMFFLSLI